MDPGAALTLQIVAYLQTGADAPRSARLWAFVPGPGGGRDTFAEAAGRLAALAKPLAVGALNQPGYVALWPLAGLGAAERRQIEHTVANQGQYADGKLAHLGAGDAARVRFESWGGLTLDLSVTELRRWLGEYALTWGWTIRPPTDASHGARLVVLHGGRTWSPGGDGIRPRAV